MHYDIAMIKKNDILTLDIIDMGINGEGIAKLDNIVIFVPFALTGEKVKVQIINTKSQFYIAKLLEVISPSLSRVEAPCPVFRKCGGCSLQHLNYQNQLEFKKTLVQNNLKRIGGLETVVQPCISSNLQYHYRNKIQMPVGSMNEGVIVGMYAPNSHRIVATNYCYLQDNATNKVIEICNNFMNKFLIKGYNEQENSGLVRHIVARTLNNQVLITIVINGNRLPHSQELAKMLADHFNNIGLYININKQQTNVILGKEFIHIYGLKSLKNIEYGIKYEILPQSFMQINNDIKSKIYEKVFEIVKAGNFDCVIDSYSGAGLLSAMLAKVANQVYGIEIIPEATQCAEILKQQNNLINLINVNGDCATELPKLISQKNLTNLCMVLDPPRKGCDKNVLDTILNVKPKQILYISCNPATLARDLKVLTQNGNYKIQLCQPYDMFPNTSHVETLVQLTQQ